MLFTLPDITYQVRQTPPLILCVGLLLAGCAGNSCRTPMGDPAITPAAISAAKARTYTGKSLQWGGVLAEARNLQDRTELEVIGYPLSSCGRPMLDSAPVGRFIVVRPGYLETADTKPGQQITASGRLTGTRGGRVGEAAYEFPLLESFDIHYWPAERKYSYPRKPWVTIGIGGGRGGVGGGIGVIF